MTAPPPISAFIPAPLVPRDSQPACDGRWDIYDALMDYTTGPFWRQARREAAELCASCPVRTQCHTRAIEVGEVWVRTVVDAIREKREADEKARPRFCACGALARPHKRRCAVCRYRKGEEGAA